MFDYLMWTYGGEIIALIVTVVFGVLGFVVKNLVKTYLNDKRSLSSVSRNCMVKKS